VPRGTVDRGKPGEDECGAWSIRTTAMEKGGRRCQAYGQTEGIGQGSELVATRVEAGSAVR
jgi:hypothetical protein